MVLRSLRRLLRWLFGPPPAPDPEPDPPDKPEPDPDPDPDPEPEPTPEPQDEPPEDPEPEPEPTPDPEPEPPDEPPEDPEPEPTPEPDDPRCLSTETVAEGPLIEVRVFHAGETTPAMVARDYIAGALAESFGDTHRVDVSVAADVVPEHVTSSSGHIEWIDEHDIPIAKDCNILVTATSQARGGGRYAIAPNAGLDRLSGDCARLYGSGWAHDQLQTVLHEVGHCLGLPHSQDAGWLPPRFGGRTTPMGTYEGGSPYLHRFHPAVGADRIDVA